MLCSALRFDLPGRRKVAKVEKPKRGKAKQPVHRSAQTRQKVGDTVAPQTSRKALQLKPAYCSSDSSILNVPPADRMCRTVPLDDDNPNDLCMEPVYDDVPVAVDGEDLPPHSQTVRKEASLSLTVPPETPSRLPLRPLRNCTSTPAIRRRMTIGSVLRSEPYRRDGMILAPGSRETKSGSGNRSGRASTTLSSLRKQQHFAESPQLISSAMAHHAEPESPSLRKRSVERRDASPLGDEDDDRVDPDTFFAHLAAEMQPAPGQTRSESPELAAGDGVDETEGQVGGSESAPASLVKPQVIKQASGRPEIALDLFPLSSPVQGSTSAKTYARQRRFLPSSPVGPPAPFSFRGSFFTLLKEYETGRGQMNAN